MKKLLCLLLSIMILFAFAACGSGSNDASSADASAASGDDSGSTAIAATSITFDAESYSIGVDGYSMLADHVKVEPAGATVVYSVSDESIATISRKGEIYGQKSGKVTVTAASEDGTVSATVTVVVAGLGTIVARNTETNEGGITNKKFGAVERPDDTDAIILVISKNIAAGADMSNAVKLNYGDGQNNDKSFVAAYDGYYVAKNGEDGNYAIENVPEGDYVGLIISSMDYSGKIAYPDVSEVITKFKATAIAKYFTDAEITELVNKFAKREFYVEEFSVSANSTTVFAHAFAVD